MLNRFSENDLHGKIAADKLSQENLCLQDKFMSVRKIHSHNELFGVTKMNMWRKKKKIIKIIFIVNIISAPYGFTKHKMMDKQG